MHFASIQIEIQQPQNDTLARTAEAAPDRTASALPVLDFVASDETLDRYGEIICAAGWRLESYRRNPVFQNAHQYGDILFTLGKALVTEVRTRLVPQAAVPTPHLFQRIQFATDVNPVARIAYGLYKGKFLNAVSVGFVPLRWQDADGTEHVAGKSASGGGGKNTPERLALTTPRAVRRRYLEQELIEVSAIGIPANPNALALGLRAGAIEKSDLRELLVLLRDTAGPSSGKAEATPPQSNHFQLARELHRILRSA